MRKEIIILLLILIGVGAVFMSGLSFDGLAGRLTGATTIMPDKTAYNNTKNCVDSDRGIFYSTPGTLKYTTASILGKKIVKEYADKCTTKAILAEYFCGGSFVRRVDTTCKNGCMNGACAAA